MNRMCDNNMVDIGRIFKQDTPATYCLFHRRTVHENKTSETTLHAVGFTAATIF